MAIKETKSKAHLFKKGQSGNPGGRPKVGHNYAELRKQMQEHGPEIVHKTIQLALAGDIQAIKLCLERLLPKLKDEGDTTEATAEQVATVLATSQIVMQELREKYKREY